MLRFIPFGEIVREMDCAIEDADVKSILSRMRRQNALFSSEKRLSPSLESILNGVIDPEDKSMDIISKTSRAVNAYEHSLFIKSLQVLSELSEDVAHLPHFLRPKNDTRETFSDSMSSQWGISNTATDLTATSWVVNEQSRARQFIPYENTLSVLSADPLSDIDQFGSIVEMVGEVMRICTKRQNDERYANRSTFELERVAGRDNTHTTKQSRQTGKGMISTEEEIDLHEDPTEYTSQIPGFGTVFDISAATEGVDNRGSDHQSVPENNLFIYKEEATWSQKTSAPLGRESERSITQGEGHDTTGTIADLTQDEYDLSVDPPLSYSQIEYIFRFDTTLVTQFPFDNQYFENLRRRTVNAYKRAILTQKK